MRGTSWDWSTNRSVHIIRLIDVTREGQCGCSVRLAAVAVSGTINVVSVAMIITLEMMPFIRSR